MTINNLGWESDFGLLSLVFEKQPSFLTVWGGACWPIVTHHPVRTCNFPFVCLSAFFTFLFWVGNSDFLVRRFFSPSDITMEDDNDGPFWFAIYGHLSFMSANQLLVHAFVISRRGTEYHALRSRCNLIIFINRRSRIYIVLKGLSLPHRRWISSRWGAFALCVRSGRCSSVP